MNPNIIFVRKDGLIYDLKSEGGLLAYYPYIPLPNLKIEKKSVLGRSGDLTISYNSYEDREVDLALVLEWVNIENFNKFFNGLPFKMYLEYKRGFYNVTSISKVDKRDSKGIAEIDITLNITPFLFMDAVTKELTQNNSEFFNTGGLDSLCSLKIYGSGIVTLYLNEEKYVINPIEDYIILDSEMLQIYKDKTNKGNTVVGDISKLIIKANTPNIISWVGNVTKIELSYKPSFFE